MLDLIERHIIGHAASWRLDVPPSTRLRPLLRANPEHGGIVRDFAAGQVGTLVFWFRPGDRKPFVVSKIVGPALTEIAIAECTSLQESANRELGYRLFPRIYSVVEIRSARVVFMETIDGPNYEIQLARAVSGPERSMPALQRVVAQQFRELGGALHGLQKISLSDAGVKWGSMAAGHAQRFLQLCPAAREIVTEVQVAAMAQRIDTVSLRTHFVLTEDHVANYLPGPRAVDQLVPDIRALCAQWPGPVAGLRILLAFFRASPIREAYIDYSWLDLLASCIASDGGTEVVGTPVRGLLDDIGLAAFRPEVIWAFVMGAFFLRGCQELDFHTDNASVIDGLRNQYLGYSRDLVRIGGALESADGRIAGRITAPRLHTFYLAGEFSNRAEPAFNAFPQAAAPIPGWIGGAARLHKKVRDGLARYPLLFNAARWAYRRSLDLLAAPGGSSRRK